MIYELIEQNSEAEFLSERLNTRVSQMSAELTRKKKLRGAHASSIGDSDDSGQL